MYRLVALGTAVVLSFAAVASALNFTPTQDNRATYAGTIVFDSFTDMQNDSPVVAFSPFSSNITASSDYDGYFADAWASQNSQIGSLNIQGSGDVTAQIGFTFDQWLNDSDGIVSVDGAGAGGRPLLSQVSASSQSLLEILFTVDMDAQYDLSGFISAGIGLEAGTIEYGSNQSASVVLYDIDHDVTLVNESVSDNEMDVSTSGLLGAGNYRFTVSADASVFSLNGEADSHFTDIFVGDIYVANAGYEGINLLITGRDQPIPEPVTTSMIGLGLGALAYQASRRRRA